MTPTYQFLSQSTTYNSNNGTSTSLHFANSCNICLVDRQSKHTSSIMISRKSFLNSTNVKRNATHQLQVILAGYATAKSMFSCSQMSPFSTHYNCIWICVEYHQIMPIMVLHENYFWTCIDIEYHLILKWYPKSDKKRWQMQWRLFVVICSFASHLW